LLKDIGASAIREDMEMNEESFRLWIKTQNQAVEEISKILRKFYGSYSNIEISTVGEDPLDYSLVITVRRKEGHE